MLNVNLRGNTYAYIRWCRAKQYGRVCQKSFARLNLQVYFSKRLQLSFFQFQKTFLLISIKVSASFLFSLWLTDWLQCLQCFFYLSRSNQTLPSAFHLCNPGGKFHKLDNYVGRQLGGSRSAKFGLDNLWTAPISIGSVSSPEWEVGRKRRVEGATLPLLPHKLHPNTTHIWSEYERYTV